MLTFCSVPKRNVSYKIANLTQNWKPSYLDQLALVGVVVDVVLLVVSVRHVDEHVHHGEGADDGDGEERALLPRASDGRMFSLVGLSGGHGAAAEDAGSAGDTGKHL